MPICAVFKVIGLLILIFIVFVWPTDHPITALEKMDKRNLEKLKKRMRKRGGAS